MTSEHSMTYEILARDVMDERSGVRAERCAWVMLTGDPRAYETTIDLETGQLSTHPILGGIVDALHPLHRKCALT